MSSNANDPNATMSAVVRAGGCYLQEELVHCALDEAHCRGLDFRSARQLRASNDRRAMERCLRPHAGLLGMCTSPIDHFHCTGHASGCAIATKFVPDVPYCSLEHNRFPGRDTHLALWGTCDADCVWSIEDCPDAGNGRTYAPARFAAGASSSERDDLPCTCDRVRTGACVHRGTDWTCAVSADACDEDADFRSRAEVLRAGRDCFLCPAFDKSETPPAIAAGDLRPWEGVLSAEGSDVGACPRGIVVGATSGALLGVLVALAVQCLCRRRRGDGKGGDGAGGEEVAKTNESGAQGTMA